MSYNDTFQLSQDTVFDLLSSSRRRFIIRRLKSRSTGIDLQTLAGDLAAQEADIDRDELTAQQRKRIYVSLYQTHIPKLADADVIQYDPDTSVVHPGPKLDSLEAYLTQTDDRNRLVWVHIGITLVGTVIVTFAILLGAFRTAAIIGAIALGAATAITAITTVQTNSDR
ncbi:DUF7344 domain-containing protein [Halalkalirubrum salinum]|uniref:DUF7344 domain-containing protein n=1 Tax=Halalkalirubrum salinum TaxID=2563889 RepID=UPI0010FAF553|nr:hypothetical protein [Halalkalirubrum salinum]